MNPFVTRITRNEQWLLPITGMCLVLGFMISMAWVTEKNRTTRYQLLDAGQKPRVSQATIDVEAFQELSTEVSKLREDNTKLQNSIAKGTGETKLLNDSLQEIKLFAGITDVEGPGVEIRLKDSSRGALPGADANQFSPDTNVHDLDVLRIVNELFSSGAEAISVNDHRVAGPTSFRCVGPTILVNDVKIASPVVIRAIGDTKTLMGGLNLNGGVLSEIRSSDPSMVAMEAVKFVRLKGFAGRTSFRLATVPKETK